MNKSPELKTEREIKRALINEVADRVDKAARIRRALDLNKDEFGFLIQESDNSRFEVSKNDHLLGVIKFTDEASDKNSPIEFSSVDVHGRQKPGIIISDSDNLQKIIKSFLEGLDKENRRRAEEKPLYGDKASSGN